MCKANLEAYHSTLRVMDVLCNKQVITVDFNNFEINKKIFKVGPPNGQANIIFSKIKPISPEDKTYFDYVHKEYELIAGQYIAAQKTAEKKLSQRRA